MERGLSGDGGGRASSQRSEEMSIRRGDMAASGRNTSAYIHSTTLLMYNETLRPDHAATTKSPPLAVLDRAAPKSHRESLSARPDDLNVLDPLQSCSAGGRVIVEMLLRRLSQHGQSIVAAVVHSELAHLYVCVVRKREERSGCPL